MGACVSGPARDKNNKQDKQQHVDDLNHQKTSTKSSKFSEMELSLLLLMYENLSQRCNGNTVTRDTFEVFFHANGLMAQLLFTKFDEKKTGTIEKEQFLKAYEVMVKGSFQEKADVLFEFFGVQNSGGIRYSQLLKILFSYPLEDLNKMLLEEDFLKELGDNALYYFGPEKMIEDRTIIEEASESSVEYNLRKGSVYAPTSNEYIQMQTRIRETVEQQRKNKKIGLPQIFQKQRTSGLPSKDKKGGSITQVNLRKNRKPSQLKSNIASVTKRYANFLFSSLKLDKEKDVFSKVHFYKLLKDHPSIFNIYMAGFHTYVWHVDARGNPQFLSITPWIEGEVNQIYLNQNNKVYLKFIRTTIFIFPHKSIKSPLQIINLEGLTVIGIDEPEGFGFKLKHRDGLYPSKKYIMQSKVVQQQWLKQLVDFKDSSIFDKYIKLERIGGGNFSNVYRGKDKQSGKLVAIKVIQPLKLTSGQRDVLKRQCGILKQCHHPNIVKFIQQYKTKSHLYIVTELLSQGDLFQYTRRNKFLEEYEAALVFKQITETIIYLNQLGIIHRDLKPQNVMIIMNEQKTMIKRVKLIDFGFGVFKDKIKDLPLKQKFAGTPGFIAPQVYQHKEYDQKIDTFSLGIILYFMLYGYLPFQSNFVEQIEDMTLNCNISLVNYHWSNVSEDAKDLINKILISGEQRITTKQVYQHRWMQNIERLKQYQGKNKRNRIF